MLTDPKDLEDATERERQTVRAFLWDLYGNMGLSNQDREERINKLLDLFEESGFKMTDGAGFMTPDRWADLSKGFGTAFRMGNVMKPMHFQIKPFWRIAKTFDTIEEAQEFLSNNSGYYANNAGSRTSLSTNPIGKVDV